MNSSISRRAFVGATGIMAAGLAACGGGSGSSSSSASASGEAESSSASTSASGSVYWLNFKPELDETCQDLASKYTEETGVPVKVTTAAAGTYQQTLTAEMDKSDAPTLFVIGTPDDVREWGDYAMDLKGTAIEDELNTDSYNMYDDSGKLVSVGYCYECFGIVANEALIEKAGHKFDEITNFETLKTVVEDIHSRAGELGFDAFVATDMDDSSSWRVTGHLANLVYYYDEQDNGDYDENTSSISEKYLANYKNVYDLMINNSLTDPSTLATGGHDPATQFMNGDAAFILSGSFDYADLSAKQPDIKILPYYCGVSGEEKAGLNCGTENCWAINDNASDDDKQATMDFIVWLVSDSEASDTLVEELGVLPFKHASKTTNEFLLQAEESSEKGNYIMDWAFIYQPNVDQYRAAIVSALNAYNADQSDENWAAVKAAFIDGWSTQWAASSK